MVKIIRTIIEKVKLRKINKLAERLNLLLDANAEALTDWIARSLGEQGWRLIHKSEKDEMFELEDRLEEAIKEVKKLKNTTVSGLTQSEFAKTMNEFLYGPQDGEE